jgi:hypothetical protein
MMRRVTSLFVVQLFALFGHPAKSQTTVPRQVRVAADRISVDQLTHDIDYLARSNNLQR